MVLKISFLLEWFQHHKIITWWLGSLSVFMFLGFLITIPILIVRLPADYFLNQSSPNNDKDKILSFLHLVYVVFKNAVGIIFILAGIAMLFLPGQGIIALIMGVSLLNIPGKHHLFLIVLQQKSVLRSMNRLRTRYNKPAFRTHP